MFGPSYFDRALATVYILYSIQLGNQISFQSRLKKKSNASKKNPEYQLV